VRPWFADSAFSILKKKEEPTEADLKNIEDLKAKEQLETAYAVLSGNSTALDVSSAEVIAFSKASLK
jgi:hypothetical protein